ncbi:hypothetical protein NDN08_003722 [Rhodosorus marinus]|uniref:FAD-binding PCMH-type domain-containing protein n=1 Tax=Rhodosorus marinus TaxID=101924 RepID=A0AAV8V378_9RHOD|nr:hypothetical protein NDN08_003722 [Rhodosorus marinus]
MYFRSLSTRSSLWVRLRWSSDGRFGAKRKRYLSVEVVRNPPEISRSQGRPGESLQRSTGASNLSQERVTLRHDDPKPTKVEVDRRIILGIGSGLMFGIAAYLVDRIMYWRYGESFLVRKEDAERVILNTHWKTDGAVISPKQMHVPEDEEDVVDMVRAANSQRIKIRPIGAALSPNFCAMPSQGAANLRKLDKVLEINNNQVIVQAGASLKRLQDELHKHGLTLRTIPSHESATVGGVISTGSHGTTPKVGPIDEEVLGMTLVTSALGAMRLSITEKEDLFRLSRVSLGMLGIITEVTLRCYPRRKHEESVIIASRDSLKKNHEKWLANSDSLKYLWYEGSEDVVVIRQKQVSDSKRHWISDNEKQALQPLRNLLGMTEEDEAEPTFSELRNALISFGNRRNEEFQKALISAQIAYWKFKEGLSRRGWSDELMKVEDGGAELVSDFCVPVRRVDGSVGADLDFMFEFLQYAHDNNHVYDSPIEQTWSRASSSALSPACDVDEEALFSWVRVGTVASASSAEGDLQKGIHRRLIKETATLREQHRVLESLSTVTSEIATRYDALDLFKVTRHRLDAYRIFLADELEKLLMYRKTEDLGKDVTKYARQTTGMAQMMLGTTQPEQALQKHRAYRKKVEESEGAKEAE